MSTPTLRSRLARASAAVLLVSVSACASVDFERTTETSGTYRSTAWSMTVFTIDMPAGALKIARENASDAGLAATVETYADVTPDWGWWNWVLDMLSIRRAEVSGTWGFDGAE
ncbi:MAG: hypothetical protein ACI8QC_003295 [Planctomycetota bacterium]|jgi:hypothetical protein